jgi:hypothetical protein
MRMLPKKLDYKIIFQKIQSPRQRKNIEKLKTISILKSPSKKNAI